MRAASWPEPVREPEEVLLVDRVQHRDRRPLDDLVFESSNRERALSAIRLWYVRSPTWQRPVRSPVEPRMQSLEIAREVGIVILPCQAIHASGGVVVPENSIRPDSRGKAESAHDPMRCLRSSTS
jgi:hypothetical protein